MQGRRLGDLGERAAWLCGRRLTCLKVGPGASRKIEAEGMFFGESLMLGAKSRDGRVEAEVGVGDCASVQQSFEAGSLESCEDLLCSGNVVDVDIHDMMVVKKAG